MCVQTQYRRTKSTRPTSTSPKQKPPKQVKTCHSIIKVSDENNKENNAQTLKKKKKQPKSVSFNEVVVVRPHSYEEVEKSVSFHEVVMVRPVLHLSDYTDQEIIDAWYVLEDKQRIKAEILSTLKFAKECKHHSSFSSLDSSSSAEDENGCTRGLEKLSDGGRTKQRRRISIREILQEQAAQQAAHEGDKPFSINHSKFRKIYKQYSRAARQHAHAVGLMDQMAVCEKIWDSRNKTHPLLSSEMTAAVHRLPTESACQELPECGSDEQQQQMLASNTAPIISIWIPTQGHLSITHNCMQDIMHTMVTGHEQFDAHGIAEAPESQRTQ